jgi:hypothetical protein
MFRIVLLVLVISFGLPVTGQNFEVDTRELLDVVKKWNYANNSRSAETFREVYADKLVFYTQYLTESKCIALKQSLFEKNPDFKQKIVSDPSFTAMTSGVIKSEFVKEVFQKGRWRKYPSYLLITYERGGYFIVGESDSETDRRLKYKPALGKPMDIPQSKAVEPIAGHQQKTDTQTVPVDTSLARISDSSFSIAADRTGPDTAAASDDSTLITAVQKEVLSDEAVAVPKKYVYFLIGFLLLTAILVLLSRPKRKTKSKIVRKIERESPAVRNEKAFEGFLTALFDPLYFTVRSHARQRVYAGNFAANEFMPSLDVEFHNKDSHVRLAVHCIFIAQTSRELLSFSPNQINRYHEFEETSGAEVYIVLGLEGDPSDPKELYLIPHTELRAGNMGYQDLQPFRKYGMFFYNATRRRLL